MVRTSVRLRRALAVFSVVAAPTVGQAADLVFGSRGEATTLDPHFHSIGPNEDAAANLFDHLVGTDATQQLKPDLALSWRPVDDKTWEFKLRPGVRWHDGSPFTADDVLFTAERARNVPNSPAGYDVYVKGRVFSKLDDLTVRVATAAFDPLTPNDLSRVYIVSQKYGRGASTQDYNDGKAAVGTGAFKLVEWVRGDRLVFQANPDSWGGKPQWDRVTIKPIRADTTRVAAVLNGDVDIIDQVPSPDIEKLRAEPKITLRQHATIQVLYFWLDVNRDVSPFVLGADGKPIFPNPLRDWRVRKAISMAIDRKAIVERVMEGAAVPAAQMIPEGFFGYGPTVGVEKYDPEGARKLLREAGHGDGFQLTVHGPSDNYPNDAKIVETVAQMLSRVGIKADARPIPRAVYFTRAGKLEFSLGLSGNSAWSGEASTPLRGLYHTYNEAAGWGPYNRARYSNPRLDDMIEKALASVDDAARQKMLGESLDIATRDLAYLPIVNPVYTWAMRKGIDYAGRADSRVVAAEVRRAN